MLFFSSYTFVGPLSSKSYPTARYLLNPPDVPETNGISEALESNCTLQVDTALFALNDISSGIMSIAKLGR